MSMPRNRPIKQKKRRPVPIARVFGRPAKSRAQSRAGFSAKARHAIPKAVESLTSLGGQAKKVITDVGAVTSTMKSAAGDIKETTTKVKEDPSLLLRRPKKNGDK